MTPTREEVERLAKRFDVNAADWRWDEDHHAARDMLRALLARAEAAEAELAVEQEARELASESDAGWEQVANAARAEAARLREAGRELHAAGVAAVGAMKPSTYKRGVLAMACQNWRAALTVEARDE